MPVKTDESSNIISHGFDSPILNLFSYPQRGCKKLAFFYSPFRFFKRYFTASAAQNEPLTTLSANSATVFLSYFP